MLNVIQRDTSGHLYIFRCKLWHFATATCIFFSRPPPLSEQCAYTPDSVGLFIAAVVSGESGDDIYEQVKVVIEEQVGPSVWVPTNQPL